LHSLLSVHSRCPAGANDDLVPFYAAVANEGALPRPHAIDSIEIDGRIVYKAPNEPLTSNGVADRVAFY
jgi:penicillin-binding protein 1A